MFRADGSGTAVLLSGNAVRRQRPPVTAQLVGDGRVTTEGADAGIEGFRGGLPDVPVWNERQNVGSLMTFPIELARQQAISPLKYPAEEADRAALPGNSLHAAEQYNTDAR